MKKLCAIFSAALFAVQAAVFAAPNRAADFRYDLNEAGDGVVITGYYNQSRGDVEIPAQIEGYPVVEIASLAGGKSFNDNYVTSVVMPDTVTKIGKAAFDDDLRKVTLSKNLTEIGDSVFRGCNRLESITLPKGITRIGKEAFRSCLELTSITLPSTLTSIGDGAFQYCAKLFSITLPEGLTTIGNYAFIDCPKLDTINFPSTLTSIGAFAFARSGDALTYNDSLGGAPLYEVILPTSVTEIGYGAFRRCESLTKVTIQGEARIGGSAFAYCKSLTTVNMPNVVYIGPNAFDGCSYLTTLTLPQRVAFAESRTEYMNKYGEEFKGVDRLPLATRAKLKALYDAWDKSLKEQEAEEKAKAYAAKVKAGFSYLEKGQYRDAIEAFDAALKINPNNVEVLIGRGQAYVKRDNNDNAIKDFTAVLDINPNNAEALIYRGQVYSRKEEYEKAMADFTAVLGISPNNAAALTGNTEALTSRGRWYVRRAGQESGSEGKKEYFNMAIEDFNAALAINPDSTEAKEALEKAQQALAKVR